MTMQSKEAAMSKRGRYTITEPTSLNPRWAVWDADAILILSEHETRAQAVAAKARYLAADERRSR